MSFYLKPPRGSIALEKLEDLCLKRWKFLQILDESCHSVEEFHDQLVKYPHLSESVMENSSKDRVSHFFMRYTVAHRGKYELIRKFISLETSLFSYRLKELDKDDIQISLREVKRHAESLKGLEWLLSSVTHILKHDMLSGDIDSIHLVPTLVAKRRVELVTGMAIIKCQNVHTYLECVFANILQASISEMSQVPVHYGATQDDQRMFVLIERISKQIRPPQKSEASCSILAKDVDLVSQYFPLCFQHVHEKLTENHRLGHHARVAYTLFLKEIGLSREESVIFWSHHYSKQNFSKNCCSHSWQEDAKKYEYSINHLYGNNGTRKNYSAHSCESIANRSTSINEELVCPFNNHDIEDFGKIPGKPILLERARELRDHRKICTTLLPNGTKRESITKPSQYFRIAAMRQ